MFPGKKPQNLPTACYQGTPTSHESPDGFSLLEVLIAIIVAAVLSSSFLGVQRQSMHLIEINLGIWDTLNLGQEILMSRHPKDLAPLPAWAVWPTTPEGKFRVLRERVRGSNYLEQYQLEVEIPSYALTMEWPKLLPLPKIDPNKRKQDVLF